MDADHRRDPFQGGENTGFFEEALAAPDEILGMLRRARDDPLPSSRSARDAGRYSLIATSLPSVVSRA